MCYPARAAAGSLGSVAVVRPRSPDLHSVCLKIWRAKQHRQELAAQLDAVRASHVYRFVGRVERNGLDHSYYPVDPPPVPDSLVAVLGDCIHSLRSALDHLAYQLVVASGTNPDNTVEFPVSHKEFFTDCATGSKRRTVDLPVTQAMRDHIDAVQPYHKSSVGQRLAILHNLDVVDKHRTQIVTVSAVGKVSQHLSAKSGPAEAVDWTIAETNNWFSPEPLTNGKVCARITHSKPRLDIAPNVVIYPDIRFGRRTGVAGKPVLTVVDDLTALVRREIIPQFLQWFPADQWDCLITSITYAEAPRRRGERRPTQITMEDFPIDPSTKLGKGEGDRGNSV